MKRVLAECSAAGVIALVTTSYTLSYTALLFGHAPADLQGQGLFIMLVSGMVLGAAGALLSTLPFTFISLEGATIAVLAAGASSLTAAMAGAPAATIDATLLTGLVLTTLTAGIAILALGLARGGAIVRFVPLQVMAGLIAASGWSLLSGGLAVATGGPAAALLTDGMASADRLLPALGWAVLAIVVTQRAKSPLVLPALVIAGILAHHLVFMALGLSLAQQHAAGWLLTAPGTLRGAAPWAAGTLALVDWHSLGQQLPSLAAAVAVTCVVMPLNLNGVELAIRQDVDIDRDLRANGIATLLSGLCGGVLGNTSMSRTILLGRLGARRRWTPAAAALLAGLAPMAYPAIFGLVPRTILGGLLIFVALGMLQTWLVEVRTRLGLLEWLTVPAVVLISIRFGFPAGVFAGLALGCITFAVIYSLGSPIRARGNGEVVRSLVDRPPGERAVLHRHGNAIMVLYLQGFIFFGTASRLLQEIRQELARFHGQVRHLVLDCSNIDGLDGSARVRFERLLQVTNAEGISLTVAGLSTPLCRVLAAMPGDELPLRLVPTLDEALEWAEDALLAGHTPAPADPLMALLAGEFDDAGQAASLDGVLVESCVPAGTILMAQGERSNHLVFVESGQASVTVAYPTGHETRVRKFGSGTMIGEIGFLLDEPRTATIRTDTPCVLWTLTRSAMERLEAEHPAAALALQRAVMRRLSLRLLDKDLLVETLMRGARKPN